jgi:hypothetical protein
MKHLFVILVFIGLLSCQNKEEKFIQAEYDKMEGNWVINTFTVSGNISDELKKTLKTGEMILRSCQYKLKNENTPVGCGGGDAQFNEYLYGIGTKYIYASKLFTLTLALYGTDPNVINNTVSKSQMNIIALINGDWDVTVTGNQMTAKQVTNKSGLAVQLMFTATKK